MERPGISNVEYARRVGVHHTMASRLRSGQRRPATDIITATARAFDLTADEVSEWLEAIDGGPEMSGAWMRANVFNIDPDTISA